VSTERGGTIHWGEIDGVSIDFPVVVEEMNSATLVYTVPAGPARSLLPGDAFEVAGSAADTATLVVALCDYRRNPWGDYLEVNLGLLVHPVGRPDEVGAFQWRMPVDQEFTCTAGNRVLGLPKSVEDLELVETADEVSFLLRSAGRIDLGVTLPRVDPVGEPVAATTVTYSYLEGVPTRVPLTIDLPTGVVDPDAVLLELGDGPVAAELRSLGLPTTPDHAAWGEGLRGTFHPTEPVGVD